MIKSPKSLNCNPCKLKIKSRPCTSNIQWHIIYRSHQREHGEGTLDQRKEKKKKNKPKTGPAPDSAFLCLMSKCFLNLQLLALLTAIPLPVSSFPRQVSHDSDISNILGSPTQSILHLHSFTQWPLGLHAGTPLTYDWPQWLTLVVERDSIISFLYL